jgi:AGCS family alanine or glycine:cation symporter
LIVHGTKRAAFSNEAGIGTATLAHGAAKTKEPVREGLIAMMEPFIDTLLVCTMTALAILVTGVWQSGEYNGIMLTAHAFQKAIGHAGVYVLLFSVLVFAFSSLFTYSYYSTKCLGFLIGADKQKYFNYFYAFAIIFGSVATINAVLNFTDGMFALMAIPTMTVAIILSPKVREATNDYISRMKKQGVI